ncbi:MAG: hypothetical protein RL033_4884 [Pseudomonadota bacterium]
MPPSELTVRGIYRYPIKGLSPQPVHAIELEAGKPFPFDRVFALVRPGLPMDPDAPRWAKKGMFLMLMLDEALARVMTRLDPDTLELSIHPPLASEHGPSNEYLLRADLSTHNGRQAVEAFFQRLVPKLTAAPRLVHAPASHFMDKPDPVLSCINLATLRSLESEWGQALHPLRFRANFYIDGAPPWAELSWVGSELQLGDVSFRVDRRNGRCGATNVNPVSAERDLDIPGALRAHFGHKDLGVYLVALTSGRIAVGDPVRVQDARVAAEQELPLAVQPLAEQGVSAGAGRFICGGCYYVYVEGQPGPEGPLGAFGALEAGWVCPDCGSTAEGFRPHR